MKRQKTHHCDCFSFSFIQLIDLPPNEHAAAAEAPPNLIRCVESKAFADSDPEINNMLYNWTVATLTR
jgi:hypothetical protein